MAVKFVRILNDQGRIYDSYTDYWKLVELSGFETCEQDAFDRGGDDVYVFPLMNGNVAEMVKPPRRCRFILHQLERPVSGLDGFAPVGFDNVWVSDRWLAGQLKDDPRVQYVPVGGHPGLGGERLKTFRWDATHQAYIYGRRATIIHDLQMRGIGIGEACWGRERDEQLASSRVGLCLHQDSLPVIEPLRMTLFSCWRLPLVAEHSHDTYPYTTYALGDIQAAIERGDGEANWQRMTQEMTFRKCVEAAL